MQKSKLKVIESNIPSNSKEIKIPADFGIFGKKSTSLTIDKNKASYSVNLLGGKAEFGKAYFFPLPGTPIQGFVEPSFKAEVKIPLNIVATYGNGNTKLAVKIGLEKQLEGVLKGGIADPLRLLRAGFKGALVGGKGLLKIRQVLDLGFL